MFDGINSLDEFYLSESNNEYYHRKLMEYRQLLQIKKDIVSFSKSQLENIDEARIRKYRCYQHCYQKLSDLVFQDHVKGIHQLNDCATKCKSEVKDLKQFLINVDKMVFYKFEGCRKGCEKQLVIDSTLSMEMEMTVRVYNQPQVINQQIEMSMGL